MTLAALASNGCASGLLLYPSTRSIPSPATRHVIALGGDGDELELWTMRASGSEEREPEFLVLSLVGNGARAESTVVAEAQCWRDQPAEIWALNYPGYGGSTGSATLDGVAASALAAFDELQKRAEGRRIFVSGFSMGTTAALHVAAQRRVDGLLLRSPPPLVSLILGRHGWWNLWLVAGIVALQVPSDLDSLANGEQVHAPAVFVLTQRDTVVPLAYQQDVVDAYGGEKAVLRVAGNHNAQLSAAEQASLQRALAGLEQQSRR